MQGLLEGLRGLASSDMAALGMGPLLAVLLMSLASSLFIAYLYQVFYRARATGSQVYQAFPLMGISITAIFISVQFSLPLSLGLLGALSIVRFRTPIKEPEEIGFILLVIATSLSAATFNLAFLGIILTVALIALLLLRSRLPMISARQSDGMLMVTLPARDAARLNDVMSFLKERLARGSVDSVSEGDTEVTVAYRFRQLEQDDIPEVHAGVKEVVDSARVSIFFHQAGNV